ncbi:hypothetical protein LDENG_00167520 [Lucifuga dentata]|nr:hypothetical protein LDENG_00167520 [Lucifuga dentata]
MNKQFLSPLRVCTKWRITCCKTENVTLRPVWWLCWCNSYMSSGSNLSEQKGVYSKQKARSSCQPILDHFDQQYSQEFGDLWTSARAVLLDPHSWQYGVMLNCFTTQTDIKHILQSQGFSTFLPQTDMSTLHRNGPSAVSSSKQQSEEALSSHYISTCPTIDDSHVHIDSDSQSLSQHPQLEPSPSPLHSSLQCYIHPYPVRFPSQPHRSGQLKQYYLLNAASLLPVLALQVRDGENILDLCSAPGGKALAIMQTATPAFLCCNEPDPHRRDWLAKTLESFLPHSLTNRVGVSAQDGRYFGQNEVGAYDKVLVDAPCSNDRSWLYSSSSHQGEQRLQQRAKLPVLQAQLLRLAGWRNGKRRVYPGTSSSRSALSAVRPGGIVVYSTCTLSSSENHAVVETVLKDCPEAEAEELWEELAIPFSNHFTFSPSYPDHGQSGNRPPGHAQCGTVASYHPRLGILVVPQPGKTWGPMFLCRIRRKK